jgi:hypothetical protein
MLRDKIVTFSPRKLFSTHNLLFGTIFNKPFIPHGLTELNSNDTGLYNLSINNHNLW